MNRAENVSALATLSDKIWQDRDLKPVGLHHFATLLPKIFQQW